MSHRNERSFHNKSKRQVQLQVQLFFLQAEKRFLKITKNGENSNFFFGVCFIKSHSVFKSTTFGFLKYFVNSFYFINFLTILFFAMFKKNFFGTVIFHLVFSSLDFFYCPIFCVFFPWNIFWNSSIFRVFYPSNCFWDNPIFWHIFLNFLEQPHSLTRILIENILDESHFFCHVIPFWVSF